MSVTKPLNFLITGGGRGIGRGLARLLRNDGHRLCLVDNNEMELKDILSNLQHQDVAGRVCNLRDPDDLKATAKAAGQFFGGHLDVLINNAAATQVGPGTTPFTDLTLEDWQASIETNLTAPMLLSQACLPLLQKDGVTKRGQGGSIIHMSSTRAHQSEPDSEGYASTKAVLIGLTHSMAVSLVKLDIRVNAILPGWINVANENVEATKKGDRWEDGLTEGDHKWHLTGRVGKVEDIFKAVKYLAEADFVSGTEIVVDGGVTRKMVYPEYPIYRSTKDLKSIYPCG